MNKKITLEQYMLIKQIERAVEPLHGITLFMKTWSTLKSDRLSVINNSINDECRRKFNEHT